MTTKKEIIIMIGILLLSYIIVFLLSSKDITNYTIADTEYWRETDNRIMLKTAYEYNSESDIKLFPKTLGNWSSINFRYPNATYEKLNAVMLMSRAYTNTNGNIIWLDIINSKTGESFHKQNICIEGSGWNITSDTISEFKIAESPNPYTKLYANRLDITKKDRSQVIVYWFMFKKLGSGDAVTMIRLTAEDTIGNTENTFNSIKEFTEEQLFIAMYKKSEIENISTAEYIYQQYGNKGILGIIITMFIPIILIIIGIRRKE